MTEILSWGTELELGDIGRSEIIPHTLGAWEYFECDIVNQQDPFIHNQKTIIYQNALRFKKSINSTDDINSTKSLMLGLYSNTDVGHVYVGNSINTITELLSCKEIVNDLIKDVILKQII